MNKEKRYNIFSEIKEENIKKRIQAHTSIQNMQHPEKGKSHGRQ